MSETKEQKQGTGAPTGPNPELYKRLAEPRQTKEEAGAALDGFLADVHAARVKHGIPELLLVPVVYWLDGDKIESIGSTAFYGNQAHELPVAATALRRAKLNHDRLIAAMSGLAEDE